jgi:hypothetical protein
MNNIHLTPLKGVRLVCAGPITKQPATATFRVVLVLRNNGGWVVWNQIWVDPKCLPNTDLQDKDSGFSEGSYFPFDKFPEAMSEFARRIDKPEEYRSLFRDTEMEQKSLDAFNKGDYKPLREVIDELTD